jgi:hypothetical protein
MPRDTPGPNQSSSIVIGIAGAEAPGSDRNSVLRRDSCDLIFSSDDRELGIEWLGQCGGGNLWPDPAGIT